ncbi:MAG: AAC(3) family N-acetyltransferase [bacterium]|nr:AAC(3) family N-acetyltransferase [bacterium]
MTQREIEEGIRGLNIAAGDVVLLHSALSSFGRVEGGAPTVVEAFLAVLGDAGTLVVPTFGKLGIITEVVRDDPRAVSSIHPIASVAAIGAQADAICRHHWKADTAHGDDTPYTRIADLGGWVCLAGVDQDRNTTLHTVEALLELPYLSDRTRTFLNEDDEETKRTWRFFPGPHRDFIGLDRLLREKGVIKMGCIGSCVVRLMRSRELIDACLEAGRADPAFVLCDNPNCADCVTQRAAIRADRLAREPFTLAATSGLAGRYIPEMVENLNAAGITNVELDLVQGRPAWRYPSDEVRGFVADLRAGGCTVSTLRCPTFANPVEEVMELAADNELSRVVIPLGPGTGQAAKEAAKYGLTLSVYNTILGSEETSPVLLGLRESGADIGFTFNGPAFARCGETPFLFSYKQKLRRFVDQLDLEDACFDGTPQPLGKGNAEVKEMISILRCASFGGRMTLTSANRAVGSLGDAIERFETLLGAM